MQTTWYIDCKQPGALANLTQNKNKKRIRWLLQAPELLLRINAAYICFERIYDEPDDKDAERGDQIEEKNTLVSRFHSHPDICTEEVVKERVVPSIICKRWGYMKCYQQYA